MSSNNEYSEDMDEVPESLESDMSGEEGHLGMAEEGEHQMFGDDEEDMESDDEQGESDSDDQHEAKHS